MGALRCVAQRLVEKVAHHLLLDQMIERAARHGFGAELFFAAPDEDHDRNVVRLRLNSEEGREPYAVRQREIERMTSMLPLFSRTRAAARVVTTSRS